MTEKPATEKFVEQIKKFGVKNVETDDRGYVRVWATEGGYGFPEEVNEGLNVRFCESTGMCLLSENHRMYREDAHHVLIFHVTYKENNDAN